MKATTYRNLSNRKEIVQVVAGQSVSAAFPQINFENAVAIVNGKEVTADYMLNEHDVLTIRELPAGVTAAIVAMVAVVVAVGVVGGIQLYKAKRAAEEAQEELEKIKKQTNRDDIDNRPFLRGASNTAAKEKSSPTFAGDTCSRPTCFAVRSTDFSGRTEKTNTPTWCWNADSIGRSSTA